MKIMLYYSGEKKNVKKETFMNLKNILIQKWKQTLNFMPSNTAP